MLTVTTDLATTYNVYGVKNNVNSFDCPRCDKIVVVMAYSKCPVVCKCGRILPDINALAISRLERLRYYLNA